MDPVDLLVFGPHPDDLEIGLGGTIAKHVANGHRVGLCDLTAGEMGSNGTIDERLAEAEAARAVLGAAWRVNLRWPDRGIGGNLEHVRTAVLDGGMVQTIGSVWSMISLTPYGAQSDDEDVPEGWPQAPFSFWFRRHDEFDDPPPSASA